MEDYMIKVTGIRFKPAGKVYYFETGPFELQKEAEVIVETSRGVEFGFVAFTDKEIEETELKAELKPILRIATEEDKAHYQQNVTEAELAIKRCAEIVGQHSLEMNLIDCEYTFDRNKLIFYFTAEGRVDFRNLVKDLASEFKTRIELRQVGVRDEAKLIKCIGPCGFKTCCSSWLGDFAPVSIKMAKDQNLSLNPTKISGVCGRLMCCLKYEHDHYMEVNKTLPNDGEVVETPSGRALTLSSHAIKEEVSVKLIKSFNKEDNTYELDDTVLKFKSSEIKRTRTGVQRNNDKNRELNSEDEAALKAMED